MQTPNQNMAVMTVDTVDR